MLIFIIVLHKCYVWSSHSFWTSSCLSSASRSNSPLLLTPFGLPRASPLPQSPILRYFSLLLDFLLPLLRINVQSSAPSHSFWTSSCLPSASKSNPPLLLAPFGLSPASPPLQSPILRTSRSFWTFSCLPSTSKSIPPLFFAPFGLPPASSPLQSPILLSFSLLLDFLLPPLHFKVQSSAISHSFWTFSCLLSTSKSNPPLFLTPFGLSPASPPLQGPIHHAPAPHHAKKADCKAIRQSLSGNSNPPVQFHYFHASHQPIPPSKAPAISATSESGTRTYLPSGTNHFPTGLSAPALTASTANFFPATQKNIIAASIAPSGQI